VYVNNEVAGMAPQETVIFPGNGATNTGAPQTTTSTVQTVLTPLFVTVSSTVNVPPEAPELIMKEAPVPVVGVGLAPTTLMMRQE
jgi:hypothetical protein